MAKPINRVRNSKQSKNMPEQPEAFNKQEAKGSLALSGWPMILGWLAMIIFAFHASTHMVGAGDTWVAMACGRHFLNHGVDTIEPFSANSHKPGPTLGEISTWPPWARSLANKFSPETVKYWHPTGWVNQNWLTHVIFYWLTYKSPIADPDTFPPSFNQLVYWKIAIYVLSIICIYYTGRILGANPALSAFFACAAMFVGRSFFDVRPAGFSNLLVAVYLLVLVLATYRNILYIWLIVPVVVFWCNVHGGYVYAFIMLVPFVVLNLLTSLSKKKFVSIGLKGIYHTVAAGFVAFIAMIVFNPFHLTNLTHTFIISVSEHAKMWRTVNEWHPAFEWSNPVGTAFPFLVLFVLCIGLTVLWLLSLLLKPRLLKAPKNELESQKKQFTILSTVFACTAAVLIFWVTFISFSLLGLDVVSFLVCTLFVVILLLSIFKSIHFIYLVVPLTLLAVWAGNPTAGYNGRYIYPFVLLPAYVTLHILASLFSKRFRIKIENIIPVAVTAVVALSLMTMIFNPFKFKLPMWHVEQFLHLRRLMRPIYERNVEVSYAHLFSTLYVLSVASIVIWLAVPYLRKVLRQIPDRSDEEMPADTYQLPRIDLALMAIVALTIYMAISSRRFIPIAAIAACPILAMFIDQMTRTISAARNFHEKNRLFVSPMHKNLQWFCTGLGILAVLVFGIGWGLQFKRVYLDSWPTDTKLNSVFMRMTASDAKPFYACRFIKDNKLSGKMFNYWTEGGFIAYGQDPDPKTGKTPLQLFMDGRAQAAYEPSAYELWSRIMSAGPIVHDASVRQRKLNPKDYAKIGTWIDQQLKKHNVWVVLMPSGQFESPFIKGIEYTPNWAPVFINNKQKLYVDTTTPQGRELFDGMFNGKTLYPEDFSKNLTLAHNLFFFYGNDTTRRKQALDAARKAFELNPSQAPMREVLFATRFPELRTLAHDFCKSYFDEFSEKKQLWAKQHGFHHRIAAVLNAGNYLREIARVQKDTKSMQFYSNKVKEYSNLRQLLLKTKRW